MAITGDAGRHRRSAPPRLGRRRALAAAAPGLRFAMPFPRNLLPRMHILRRLTLAVAAATLVACRSAGPRMDQPVVPDTARIASTIHILAADSLEGRRSGTPGNDSAAAFLARQLSAVGARPLLSEGYLQPFTVQPSGGGHAGIPESVSSRNVVGFIPGRDPALRGQYLVVGAHFDHLGRSSAGALDSGTAIRNGADDNASGTAAVLELARLLQARPTRRSVIVVFFSGEEQGLLGSQYFVEHLPVPLDSVQAMINFDMVGRLRDDRLIVYGVATATELPAIVDSANVRDTLSIVAQGDGFGPSDHSSFYAKDRPVLHLFTDLHEDYHRATDDADRVNVGGVARVVAFAERVTRALGDRPERLTFVRAPVTAPTSPRARSQAYLGTVPDMSAGGVDGMRISGVRPGSPADSAGLTAGDVIVELGGTTVKDLYTYSDALYAHQPGDRITIVFLRDGERHAVEVTLGRRGG